MNSLRSVVCGLSVIFAGSLVVACSSSDGSDGPVWTATTSQGLACQSEGIYPDGVRPEGCPIGKPPPAPPPVTPCPTGFTCSVVATTMPAPVSGCSAPALFTQTATSGGQIAAEYVVATCSNTPTITAWIAANPTFDASESTAVPGLSAPPTGSTYLEYMPPTPGRTAFPGSGAADAGDGDTGKAPSNPAGNLPCTDFFTAPSTAHVHGFAIAYCVDLPSVAAWATTNYPNSNVEFGAGVASSPGDGIPDAAPGYVYLEVWSDFKDIGGMCGHGCGGY